MRGSRWQDPLGAQPDPSGGVVLVRGRAGMNFERPFDSLDELRAWALAGGEWAVEKNA